MPRKRGHYKAKPHEIAGFVAVVLVMAYLGGWHCPDRVDGFFCYLRKDGWLVLPLEQLVKHVRRVSHDRGRGA
jgi:hypothetical protein